MKTGIAHVKEMHDLSPMFNIFRATKIPKLKLRPENYKMKLKSYQKEERNRRRQRRKVTFEGITNLMKESLRR